MWLKKPLDIPDGVSLYGMKLSTNRDYLFFRTRGPMNESPLGFAIYNIEKEKFEETYFTELKTTGPVRFVTAQDESFPGVIYAYLRDRGIYAIDVLEKQLIEQISGEHGVRLTKYFHLENNEDWILVHNELNGDGGYEELQIFKSASNLQEPLYNLNENGRDGISIYDFELSKNTEQLFITYQLSDGRSRNIESYFGSYNLMTGDLSQSELIFPWSLNPYYMTYNSKRNEVYTIGAYREFHIIDTQTYEREDIITLPEKISGPSRIELNPEKEVAFVSAASTDTIFVIDLKSQEIIKKIDCERPYFMVIP